MNRVPLVRRIITEHRRIVIGLAVALAINIVAYVFLVMPLQRQVADVAGRDERATRALMGARSDHNQATGTLTGKDRAATELATFYTDVLPADVSSARRLVYLRLHQLAREAGLRYVRGSTATTDERSSTLVRLKSQMELVGPYASVRSFIHQLDAAPEFVVIDNIQLTEDDEGSDLRVQLDLSTYYRKP
jgi:Tfp pilus assembly protein PilO